LLGLRAHRDGAVLGPLVNQLLLLVLLLLERPGSVESEIVVQK
jgi:hypothetical protein